ncbi:universal stress protein [Methanofollis sp.]|uniref:universal stress protein n=1 Tax=Methanofollis sp. TaxID=2052835 RepID=UPI00345B1C6F
MFRKVLFPTDFSECSYKALDCVRQLARAGTGEVVVVHVLDEREFELAKTEIGWLEGAGWSSTTRRSRGGCGRMSGRNSMGSRASSARPG